MLAAEAAYEAVTGGRQHDELTAYPAAFERSWLNEELQQTRNFKVWFKRGRLVGNLMTGIEQWLLPKLGIRKPPWTLHNRTPDHARLKPADSSLTPLLPMTWFHPPLIELSPDT